MGLCDYVNFFPHDTEDQIPRDNLTQKISNSFGPECQVQIIYGDSNIGKTNFLAQYCRYHPDTAVSYFIGNSPLSQLQEEFLFCMVNQINSYLGLDELPIEISIIELKTLFSRLIQKLSRISKNNNEKLFIVIDGLEYSLNGNIGERIFDLFPIPTNAKGPYLLLSVDQKYFQKFDSVLKIDKKYELLPFTELETRTFFSDLDISKEDISIIHKKTKGSPGFLREVKDYCKQKQTVNFFELSNHIEKIISDQIDLIYQKFSTSEIDILEVVSVFPVPMDLSILSVYTNKSKDELFQFCNTNDLVELLDESKIVISKESIKSGILKKIHKRIAEISRKLVNLIDSEEIAKDSFTYTLLLRQAEDYDKSLELLDQTQITKIINTDNNVISLIRSLEVVLNMANERNDYEKILNITLALTVLKTLFTTNVNQVEISALISIGEEEEAIFKANSIPEIINRIKILARAYSSIKKKNQKIPKEALIELKDLVSQLNVEDIEKEIIKDLAYDLFPIMQEEAIELIEKVFKNVEEKNVFEITAYYKSNTSIESIGSKLKNPEYSFLIDLFSPQLAKLSLEQLLLEISDIENTRTKEYIIRNWCVNNANTDDLINGLNYWYDLVIKDSTYTLPLSNLVSILSSITDCKNEKVYELLSKLEVIADTSIKSPYEEWVKCQLNFTESYYINNYEKKARTKLSETYKFVKDKVENIDSKLYCLARLWRTAVNVTNLVEDLTEQVKNEFEENFFELKNNSADHYKVFANTFKELLKLDPKYAIEKSFELNTIINREKILILILRNLLLVRGKVEDLSEYIDLIFLQFSMIDRCIQLYEISEFLVDNDHEILEVNILCLMSYIDGVSDAYIRSKVFINFAQLLRTMNDDLAKEWSTKSIDAWKGETDLKLRLGLGFSLVNGLANINIDKARALCKDVQKIYIEPGATLVSGEFDFIYKNIIILIIRSFSTKNISEDELHLKVINLIERFPSPMLRIELYAQTAASIYRVGLNYQANEIVRSYILTNINNISSHFDKSIIIPFCFPVIFQYDIVSAEKLTEDLPKHIIDNCWFHASIWSLSRNLLDDPVNYEGQRYPSDLHSLRDLSLKALSYIDQDSFIYEGIKAITQSVLESLDKKIDLTQALVILSELESIIEKKLPDNNNIKHKGYYLVSKSKIYKAKSIILKSHSKGRRLNKQQIKQEWQNIIHEIDKIENLADKLYVYCLCGEDYYHFVEDAAFQLISTAESFIMQVPATYDRQNRFTTIAQTYDKLGKPEKASKFLKQAVEHILNLEISDSEEYLHLIIQAAYDINEELANELVSRLDKRLPPYSTFTANLEKQIHKLVDAPTQIVTFESYEKYIDYILRKSSNKLLKELLANRSTLYGHDVLSKWLITSSYYSYQTYFSVAGWVIESNRLERILDRIKTSQFTDFVNLVFEIGKLISPGKRDGIPDNILNLYPKRGEKMLVFQSGEREKALQFVLTWLRENSNGYLKIIDPYFGYDELEILSHVPNKVKIIVISTDKYFSGNHDEIKQKILVHWQNLSSRPLPNIMFLIVPQNLVDKFHDRAIVTMGKGLNMGQSLNGLGKKYGTISIMDINETEELENQYIDPLLSNTTWFINQEIRPIYISFDEGSNNF